jgi:hypothetical protein
LLNDADNDNHANESVTVARSNAVGNMSELSRVKTPEDLFVSREVTKASINAVHFDEY